MGAYAKIPGKPVQLPELRCIVHGGPGSGGAFNTLLPDNVRSCDGPLEAQKGRFILKYFLLEERRKGPAELSREYLG